MEGRIQHIVRDELFSMFKQLANDFVLDYDELCTWYAKQNIDKEETVIMSVAAINSSSIEQGPPAVAEQGPPAVAEQGPPAVAVTKPIIKRKPKVEAGKFEVCKGVTGKNEPCKFKATVLVDGMYFCKKHLKKTDVVKPEMVISYFPSNSVIVDNDIEIIDDSIVDSIVNDE
jgi:cobalamin-dependent methionine synthase I